MKFFTSAFCHFLRNILSGPFFGRSTVPGVIVFLGCVGVASDLSWARERSDIFRQSRSGTVLLVSVDKVNQALSFGTGFFISQTGHILTNAHVLADHSQLLVYVPDQGVYSDAKAVVSDQDMDVAVLHLPQVSGRALPLSAGVPEEGTDGLVVGYPRIIDTLQMGLTLHSTVKPVSVSNVTMGRSRTEGRITPFIQVSGTLHSGTSGGPLVQVGSGEVSGMVVHSVPYIGQATDRKGSKIGSVLLRADMSYAIPSHLIRQWLVDHDIPIETAESPVRHEWPSGLFTGLEVDSDILGMSLFLTGHLLQTIADTIHSETEFMALAMHHYLNALELFPGKTVIAQNLALTYRSLHRYQEALEVYERLLQQSPSDLLLLTEAAQVSQDLHLEEKAMATYRTVLERESCYVDALNGLGNIYLGKEKYLDAVRIFQRAVICRPSSAYAAFYLGESMVRSGLVEEAQAVWKSSLERISIHSPQEKELYERMRARTVVAPSLLPRAALLTTAGHHPKTISQ